MTTPPRSKMTAAISPIDAYHTPGAARLECRHRRLSERGQYPLRNYVALSGRKAWRADLVVLSEDVFTCPEARIAAIAPALTLIDGEVVFRRTERR